MLLRACPDEEDTIHQIVNLLVDTCSSKRRMLRVAGDDKPAEVVRSRFVKLNGYSSVFAAYGFLCADAEIDINELESVRYQAMYLAGAADFEKLFRQS